MTDTHETTADLIAWLRRPREGENAYLTAWRDEIADRLEAAHRRERGNAAKLREACANIAEYARSAMCHATDAHLLGYLNQIEGWSKAALSTAPRNCDVGTVEEQSERKIKFCHNQGGCFNCSFSKSPTLTLCALAWAQMPYKEGGAE